MKPISLRLFSHLLKIIVCPQPELSPVVRIDRMLLEFWDYRQATVVKVHPGIILAANQDWKAGRDQYGLI